MKRIAAFAVVMAAASVARADAPRVRADVSPEVVAPGAPFELQIEATSSDPGGVAEVSVPTPAGFRKLGEHKTTTSQISMSPSGTERRQGLSVVYTFVTNKVGTFKLGPIAVRAGSQRYSAEGPRVQVAKDAPPPPQTQDPFAGLFGGKLPGLSDDPFFNPPPQRGTADPALALPEARGDVLFFHARTDPSDLILGQRLYFDVLEYIEEGIRPPEFVDVHEAKTNDFLSKPIEVKREPREIGHAEFGGKRYVVKLFRRYELAPLHAGKLAIGPLVGQVPTRSGKTTSRESEPLTVVVREPPAAGRPNGYALGTVGTYEIKADPLPATMRTGDRTALVIRCTGTGTPPAKLQFADLGSAARLGEPEIVDEEGPTSAIPNLIPGVDEADSRLATVTRTFKYLLEVREPGRLDLGVVSLPTYLTAEKRYTTLTAPLGVVEVNGDPKVQDADDSDPKKEHVVLELGAPVTTLAGSNADKPTTLPAWAYVVPFAVPGLSWLAALARSLGTRARERRERKPAKDLRSRLDETLAGASRENVAPLLTFARLLVEHVAGESVPRDEWSTALGRAGKSPADVTRFTDFAAQLDEARYAGTDLGDSLLEQARSWRKQWGP